ncbi:U-box domain-containing protein 5-like [Abrus precatorius]|uniref:U-box domain-containing protein 5-like n=1 Tax=Abrus precatorius TaxID=3816 RepID=A0A8B8JPK0_ABRPR|nr:U-box domain-containing protein 5-like [Abrus precatorius]
MMMSSNDDKALQIPVPIPIPIPSYWNVKVHRSICLELHILVDKILHIILAIESARPNCALAMQTLCSLHFTLDKAKSVIRHCSECSKLYLAITSHKILSRSRKIQHAFELNLAKIQNAVPVPMAAKISAILHDLRHMEFSLEFEEDDAWKVLRSLLEKDFPDSASMEKEELEAIQVATSRLKMKSLFSLLVEKATLKRQLDEVNYTNQKEKELLQYLLYLLIKNWRSICQVQNRRHALKNECHDQSFEHKLVVDGAICENQVNDSVNPKVGDL